MKTYLMIVTVFVCVAGVQAAEDVLIADFEGSAYGDWKVTGTAFGLGPAAGTLKGQMQVSGYEGKRLVNSFCEGDGSTGTLTSPTFTIECKYISFLIGGGMKPGKACMNLLVGGKVVRTATGPNDRPGGTEALDRGSWDVADLLGKKALIQIVDQQKGGWGHINVDHIVQTDTKPKGSLRGNYTRDMTIKRHYLIIPIRTGARKCKLELEVAGEVVREYTTEIAEDGDKVDFYAYFTIESYKGQSAIVRATGAPEKGFALIQQSDTIPGAESFYTEALRPQLRFSQKVGWNNDTNGMVYYDGEWHVYFQHNPVGWNWGNMTWGHFVSTDLVHWEQLPNVLFPSTMAKGACFSGGGLVDPHNTAGFQTGRHKVIIAALTDTGAGEAIAYSNDRGRTFTWYDKNPVVKHKGRDPKIIWYEPGQHWVMAVYDETEQHGRNIAFYTSKNLKRWDLQSHLSGYYECPELFELPVDGDKSNTRWVLLGADARYVMGSFDGKTFTPEQTDKHRVHYGAYYASQTFSDTPDGRRIQIGWARIAMPGMPFNQAFTLPHRLTLRSTADGIHMFAKPVKELSKLRQRGHRVGTIALSQSSPVSVDVSGELFEIRATFEVKQAQSFGLDIGGNRVIYDVKAKKLNGADLASVDGKISMQVFVDRPMIEISGNDGRVYITSKREKRGEVSEIKAFAEGGRAQLVELDVYELNSIWTQ
jgi:fructan beta-fructosidase